MSIQFFRSCVTAVALTIGVLGANAACAGVVVTTSGNTAVADISLTDGINTYAATVTITFDTPVNLSADELNLTAQLVDPSIASRLPSPCLPLSLLGCVAVDPAFPLLVTVEPLNLPWLFRSEFETSDTLPGNLSFLNTYEIEVRTANLPCTAPTTGDPCTNTPYRLFKAPVDGSFTDYTDDVLKGSVRARGRGGAFSQFLVAKDTRASLTVGLGKVLALDTRILAASLNSTLQGDLLGLVADIDLILLTTLDYTAAILKVDQLIAEIQAHAGVDIANRWSSDHTLINDAGEMEGLAQTLRYTLVRLQNGN
jgi:hypothetical protein